MRKPNELEHVSDVLACLVGEEQADNQQTIRPKPPQARPRSRRATASEKQALKRAIKRKPRASSVNPDRLPYWPDDARVSPSALLRSALFGIVKRGGRRYIDNEELAVWANVSICYTGKQLDQYDLDVWLQVIHVFRNQVLREDTRVAFTARSFLKAIGRDTGGASMKRLFTSLDRMVACSVKIDVGRYVFARSLIEAFNFDKPTGLYKLQVSKELCELFDTGYTRFNWKTRHDLRSDLAKWLHAYISSHKTTEDKPHMISVEKLKRLTGSVDGRRSFKQQLREAMERLKAAHVVSDWRLTPNDVLEVYKYH